MQLGTHEATTDPSREEMERIFSRYCFDFQRTATVRLDKHLSDAIRAFNVWNKADDRCREMYLGIHWLFYVWCGWNPPQKLERGASSNFNGWGLKDRFPTTVEGMIEVMEAHVEEERQEALEQYEDDPEWGEKYYNHGHPSEVHPWGEDTLRAVRAWLYAPAFERFCIKHKLNTIARDHAETHMFDYAIETDCESIEDAIRTELDAMMKAFVKHHEENHEKGS